MAFAGHAGTDALAVARSRRVDRVGMHDHAVGAAMVMILDVAWSHCEWQHCVLKCFDGAVMECVMFKC